MMRKMQAKSLPELARIADRLKLTPECEITLELRARVRYQNADSHGFEFVDLTAAQQKDLQRCLHAIAAA